MIDQEVTNKLISTLSKVEDEAYLYINSYGGVFYDFLAIYDYIQNMECKVNTIGIGKCMSAGALILMSGTGYRTAYPNTSIMLHNLQTGYHYDSIEDIRITHQHNIDLEERLIDIIVEHTGKNIIQVNADIERDLYMTPEEAVEYGIIDNIVGEQYVGE